MHPRPLNLLHRYYTTVSPNRRVLEFCGATESDTPYTRDCDDNLTAVLNAYARPEYTPLVWEAIQYQSRRPRETWIVQNYPGENGSVPSNFYNAIHEGYRTVIFDSGLNLGCWFRFFLAALYCRTRYVAIYDDDTLSGRLALETALNDLSRKSGIYGGRGITFKFQSEGPRFWSYDVGGWPVGTEEATEVDFVGHLWVMETQWLRQLFNYIPGRLFAEEPASHCGEDMYLSFVAQKIDIPTYVFGHGQNCGPRWSSIQAYEMGFHPNAMNITGGLNQGESYLRHFLDAGWKLLRYRR